MPAGLNLSVRVWRFTYPADDDVGGSLPSGTTIYDNIQARRIDHLVHIRKIPMLEEDQGGLESGRYNLFELYPSTIQIRENDEIQIINPPNNWDYLNQFRIISIMREGYHPDDPRGILLVSCRRSVIAHAIQ
jgi:hypothetical protein